MPNIQVVVVLVVIIPSMICRCFVMMSSVIRCCRCIFCNRSPLRRSSYDSTSRSPCSAILSASNSCTRHINDSSSRSVSESKRLGRFCEEKKNVKQWPNLIFKKSHYVFKGYCLLTNCVQFTHCFGPECNVPFLLVFYVTQVRPRLVHVQLIVI